MRKFISILFLFFCTSWIFSQSAKIDSLKSLVSLQKEDTQKVNLFNQVGYELIFIAEYEEAEQYIENAKLLSKKLGFDQGLAKSYNAKGIICRNKGDNKRALKNYFESLELSKKLGNMGMIGSVSVNIGRIYVNLGDFPRALEYYNQSLIIQRQLNNKSRTANTLRGIGKIYLQQKDIKAKYCFFEALKLYEEEKIYDGIAGALNDIGEFYSQEGDLQKALQYYFKSLEASNKATYITETANSHNNIGLIYSHQKKYSDALEHYSISLSLYKKLNNIEEQAALNYNIGELYYEATNYKQALEYYSISLEMAIKSGVLQKIKDAHDGLSRGYEKLNRPIDALFHYKSFIIVKEQIFNDDNTKRLLKAELNFELIKKEQDLKFEQEKIHAKLKQERTQRYFLIVSIAFIVLLGLFLFQRLTLRQKLKVSKLRNKIAIDLHDEVGSALSSISMYAGITQMNKETEINDDIIDKIGKTSRETIENMSDIVWSIQPKNDNFQLVLDKMEYFGNYIMGGSGIKFNFKYSDGIQHLVLDMEQRKNLYLIYKEAVNNAAKYSNASLVEVMLKKRKKIIQLQIVDNGIGFDVSDVFNGNGLNNMKERAQALKGKFDLSSEPSKGTSIFLSFKIV